MLYKEEEVDAPVEAMAAQQWYVDALDRGMFALENIEAPETLDGLLNNAGLDKELNGDVWFKYNTEGSAGTLILPERVPTYGYHSFTQAQHHIIKYLIGYYSQLRPHKHTGGMSPNKAEENYWVNYKSVASFT